MTYFNNDRLVDLASLDRNLALNAIEKRHNEAVELGITAPNSVALMKVENDRFEARQEYIATRVDDAFCVIYPFNLSEVLVVELCEWCDEWRYNVKVRELAVVAYEPIKAFIGEYIDTGKYTYERALEIEERFAIYESELMELFEVQLGKLMAKVELLKYKYSDMWSKALTIAEQDRIAKAKSDEVAKAKQDRIRARESAAKAKRDEVAKEKARIEYNKKSSTVGTWIVLVILVAAGTLLAVNKGAF